MSGDLNETLKCNDLSLTDVMLTLFSKKHIK